MKSLIMAALISVSPTVTAMEPAEQYPVMDEAAGLARVILMQCKTKGAVIIRIIVDGKMEQYLIDCVVTELEGTEQ